VSDVFRHIVEATGLPPVSFRDLRHLAATLMHAGGADTHTIKETLRHASIQLTSDTYTSLLPELDRQVAEKAARLVPRSRREAVPGTSGLTSRSPTAMKGDLFPHSKPGLNPITQLNAGTPTRGRRGAGGTRTHDRRIMSPLL
jgi:Phage integrase family